MKKSKTLLFVLFVLVLVFLPFENSLMAQRNNNEKLVSAMNMMKNTIIKSFSGNKQLLVITQTENMLNDDQCQKWVGKQTLLQKIFTQIDDCTGDSLYNEYYENGLLIQRGMGDQLFFLGNFKTGNNELYSGQEKKQVKSLLGSAYKESDLLLVYKKELHPEIVFYEDRKFDESVVLFFKNDKLDAVWVTFYMIC